MQSIHSNIAVCNRRTLFLEHDWFFYWDMAICRFYRPSAILELFYHHTRPPTKSLLLAAAACQISCQSDTQIWRYSYLSFFPYLAWNAYSSPKMGVLGDFGPLNVIINHRDPQGSSLRKSASANRSWNTRYDSVLLHLKAHLFQQ